MSIKSKFYGKTIKSIDTSTSNVWIFHFTDGTSCEVWAECGSSQFDLPFLEVYE